MKRGRLLVVSHANVVSANQSVLCRLEELGWHATLIVPWRWRHAYSSDSFAPQAAPALRGRMLALRVVASGRAQRHAYVARLSALVRSMRPDVAFVEEEYFSVSALQWAAALTRAGVPFGVQAAENLDRTLPRAAHSIRRYVLRRAAFVAARSPAAAALALRHGARGEVGVAPHAVPRWKGAVAKRNADGPFTIGFAGRFVREKGLHDLVHAVRALDGDSRLLFVGDGPLRNELEEAGATVVTGVRHERMPDAFAQMDVLVLPSRSTSTWEEQFGRVLVEALACGVPVVGSDSGEIPWVIESTGGGIVFPEGDERALVQVLASLRDAPARRAALGEAGRSAVERLFAVEPAAAALDALLVEAAQAKSDG